MSNETYRKWQRQKLLEDLIYAGIVHYAGKHGKVGEIITKLSDERRELIKQLKSDDIKNIRPVGSDDINNVKPLWK